jgi:hypothetical protein
MAHKHLPELAPRSFQHLLMHRIYRVLRTDDFVLRFDRMVGNPETHARHGVDMNSAGTVDDPHEDMGTITVDHRYDIIASVVHECLHVIYPEATEEQIQALERFVIRDMHPAQAKRLLILMTHCIDKKTPAM